MNLNIFKTTAVVAAVVVFAFLLIKQNWKTSEVPSISETDISNEEKNAVSESEYELLLTESASAAGLTVTNDLPFKPKSNEEIDKFIELSMEKNLADWVAHYLLVKHPIEKYDTLFLQAARYYIVAAGLSQSDEGNKLLMQKAKQSLQQYKELQPNDEDAEVLLAYTKVRTEAMPMDGIAMLKEVLEKNPENTDALYMMGEFSIESQQFEKALDKFRKLLSLQPQNSDYHFKISEVFSRMNEKDSAEFYLKKGVELRKTKN